MALRPIVVLVTTHQGEALIVLNEREVGLLMDTIAMVLATEETNPAVELPPDLGTLLKRLFRALQNSRRRQAASGAD